MHKLVDQSLAIITAGQSPEGAYIACPSYPTYAYSWFRDGTFIAAAMDRWQRHESAQRFYTWASSIVVARAAAIERCITNATQGRALHPADLLDTRYTLDGRSGDEEWPNFQLDGFGTLLWGMQNHLHATGQSRLPADWSRAADLLVRYLAALWQLPNSDCWEEFPEQIAVSTLACLHAGLHAISTAKEAHDPHAALAAATARHIKTSILSAGVLADHLIKQINGEDVVDASLLWACVPFEEHGVLAASDPLMRATVARIEHNLTGQTGGIHRYRNDTFYGGGEWINLTALLGEYHAATGNRAGLQRCLAFIEAAASPEGHLPEQISHAPLHPAYVEEWRARWGNVASPLLWSHAAYLSLVAASTDPPTTPTK